MHMWVAVLIVSVLSVCPMMVEAGTTGDQPPEQRQIITKDNLKFSSTASDILNSLHLDLESEIIPKMVISCSASSLLLNIYYTPCIA